jgi:hypothetical protein
LSARNSWRLLGHLTSFESKPGSNSGSRA